MKNYKAIKEEIKANLAKIKENDNKIEALDMIQERRAAADIKDFAKVKELRQESEKNADKIAALCDESYKLKIINSILSDNEAAAMFNEVMPIIKSAFAKYEGKPYGEKTSEKIREEVKKSGFCFYIDGFMKKDTIKVYEIENGYKTGSCKEIEIHEYKNPFIDSENKIRVAESEPTIYEHYTENPEERAAEILRLHQEYKRAAEILQKAQSELSSVLPSHISIQNKVTYINPTLNV